MSKINIGVVFGGISKEREISFAGGRTVYDNLNKSIFEPIPFFVDSFGNFIELNWEFIYKGSIRDFYPPVEFIPASKGDFQIYAESLGDLSAQKQLELINKIGKKVTVEELKIKIDFAFLCLHGPFGEDGKIQGLFDYYSIPYSGSGILPSAIGIDKAIQKKLMIAAGFNSPKFFTIKRAHWHLNNSSELYFKAKQEIGFPVVVKSANQGSSIGISILHNPTESEFLAAVNKSFFTYHLSNSEWSLYSEKQKNSFIRILTDIREGVGIPVKVSQLSTEINSPPNGGSRRGASHLISHPDALIEYIDKNIQGSELLIESIDAESEVIIEAFIEGKEFSCIVVQDEEGKAIALPPTEIRKGKELFDYRSKYLPGLSRKITPIDLPNEQVEGIRKECVRLFDALDFGVYARIDGFIKVDGSVFLNDPNTTSGMMPSSFFFHQAAEIGLNPSQFLTFIIRTSLAQRIIEAKVNVKYSALLVKLDDAIDHLHTEKSNKIKVAVILGGYSSERHISVESGRNIYEKLASSAKYAPIPVFLTGDHDNHLMFQIPINVLLKDNADDIKEKIDNYKIHPLVKKIIDEVATITHKYGTPENLAQPKKLSYADLKASVDRVFIALHGRPGEDGAVQANLEKIGLPYNGSGVESSQITINKYQTNELLKQNGLNVASHFLITEDDWKANKDSILARIEKDLKYPFIAKPVDDGCSSAVKKIKTKEEFEAFAKLIFRTDIALDSSAAEVLHIRLKEEFPQKNVILVEELIDKKASKHFLEITGGMLTKYDSHGKISYEVFEASEALSEGDVLSLEEKFLAGQGQNITPARYSTDPLKRQVISNFVKKELEKAAKILNVVGYCRIDAFVRIHENLKVEVIFIEVNSLPGMTPATCIFHQTAINGYKPYDFIDKILEFGAEKSKKMLVAN